MNEGVHRTDVPPTRSHDYLVTVLNHEDVASYSALPRIQLLTRAAFIHALHMANKLLIHL